MVEIQKGEYGFDLIISITDQNGNAVDLSGLDLNNTKLKIWKDGSSTLKIDSTVSFYTDGTDGKLKYTVKNGDFDEEGIYHAEIVLIWPGIQRAVSLEDIIVENTAPV